MHRLQIYNNQELPPHIKWQISAFVRIRWAYIFKGDLKLWDGVIDKSTVANVILSEENLLISRAEINSRNLNHAGKNYNVYGLSWVFTFPSFQRQGYGKQVVKAATEYIRNSDADIAIGICRPNMTSFYTQFGWVLLDRIEALYGNPDNPTIHSGRCVIMIPVSKKGHRGKKDFENYPVYIGNRTW